MSGCPLFPQSGEGKANKVYKYFREEIRALSTKGKNKNIKMKGKRWGEMYAALLTLV